MLAEAFRQPGERMPIAGLGLIGLARRRGRVGVPLGHRRAAASASSAPTTSRCSSTSILCVVGVLTMLFSNDVVERDHLPAGRVLRADAVRHLRHDDDGGGHRPAGHLHRARDSVAGRLRADRHPPRERDRRRGGVQVLPARRRSRARSSSTASHSPSRVAGSTRLEQIGIGAVRAGASGPPTLALLARRAAGRRLRVQGVGGAVPHVDARRLRRRADHRHRRSCRPA